MNIENQIYCCDNLKLLKQLPSSCIDLIYCDVLFGTNRNFGEYKDIKSIPEEIKKFYKPRIKQMHRVLKETGSIYMHLDWRISHWIRCLMDDIFGYKNFRNEIIWSYFRYTSKSNNFQKMHDTILRYSKSKNFTFNQLFRKYQKTTLKYHKWEIDKDGKEFYWKKGRKIETYKIYKNEKGVRLNDVWQIPQIGPISIERTGYPTQKPKALLKRIIRASSKENDIVADFFCGSGTTLVAAIELNRKYIGCDSSEEAIKIVRKRIAQEKRNPGFKIFK